MRRCSHLLVAVLIGGMMATGVGSASAQTQDNGLVVTAVCTSDGDVLQFVNEEPTTWMC